MNLSEIILENERLGKDQKNAQLIKARLKQLVEGYPREVREVLNKTGIPLKSELPPKVLFAIIVKHVHKNSKLRDAIAKMLLEMDGYHRADGQWVGIIGAGLSAVGSVLSGIGQGQFQNTPEQLALQQQQMQLEQERRAEEDRRKRRSLYIFLGVAGALIGLFLLVRAMKGRQVQQNVKLAT